MSPRQFLSNPPLWRRWLHFGRYPRWPARSWLGAECFSNALPSAVQKFASAKAATIGECVGPRSHSTSTQPTNSSRVVLYALTSTRPTPVGNIHFQCDVRIINGNACELVSASTSVGPTVCGQHLSPSGVQQRTPLSTDTGKASKNRYETSVLRAQCSSVLKNELVVNVECFAGRR